MAILVKKPPFFIRFYIHHCKNLRVDHSCNKYNFPNKLMKLNVMVKGDKIGDGSKTKPCDNINEPLKEFHTKNN